MAKHRGQKWIQTMQEGIEKDQLVEAITQSNTPGGQMSKTVCPTCSGPTKPKGHRRG